MDFPSNLIPTEIAGPVLVAGLGWFAVNYLVLTPEVATRLSHLELVPDCVEGVAAQDQERVAAHTALIAELRRDHERQISQAQEQAEAAQAELERQFEAMKLLQNLSPAGRLLKAFDPDGEIIDGLHNLAPRAPALPDPVPLDLPPQPKVTLPEDRQEACAEAAAHVIAEHRWDWTLWTASGTLWEPASVRNTAGLVAETLEAGYD